MKKTLMLSGMLAIGFGVLLAFADPNSGSPNYVQPIQIVVPKVDIPGPTGYTVTTNSRMIVPPRNIAGAAQWATNGAYQNGSIVQSGNALYWNSAPVFTNCTPASPAGPNHLSGSVADAGGAMIWTRFYANDRQGIDVVNETADNVWLSVGAPAVTNAGIALTGRGSSWFVTGPWVQKAVYSITTNSVHVTVDER